MKKIEAIKSMNANYIFHMLSVAKVGYDNEYGSKYRDLHDRTDLETLQKSESLITVKGGEHCGELYGLLVSIPAGLDDEFNIKSYYGSIVDLFSDITEEDKKNIYESTFENIDLPMGNRLDFEQFQEMFSSYADCINEISKVFKDNTEIYRSKVWPQETEVLEIAIKDINDVLVEVDYIEKWEMVLGSEYHSDKFMPVICNSIAGGAQAINVTSNKNIFAVPEHMEDFLELICHEIGIFIMLPEAKGSLDVGDYSSWIAFESLAACCNEVVYGKKITRWTGDEAYVRYYEKHFYKIKEKSITSIMNEAKEFIKTNIDVN